MKIKLWRRVTFLHGLIGAVVGIAVLHPMARLVYWSEIQRDIGAPESFWYFLKDGIDSVFSVHMLPMTAMYALIGLVIGVVFGWYHLALISRSRALSFMGRELAQGLASVIAQGEGEHIEFKSSLRWDTNEKRANRALEGVVVKTIAGFMNHRGGSLVIGVSDSGNVLGLAGDYNTLKHKNRDGFERCLINLVKTRLGGDHCSLIHLTFGEVDFEDVCRVIVEPSPDAVYCQDGGAPKYYLRTGNATRELNVKEAMAHGRRREDLTFE